MSRIARTARRSSLTAAAVAILAAAVVLLSPEGGDADSSPQPPPANAGFDYQIGGDYPLPDGVSVVSRDWFSGEPAADPAYSICYLNAFQTQADESGTDRPDEHSNWPRKLILSKLGDDPKWGGEYLVDIRNAKKRKRAARWLAPMIETCAARGYEAVEFDNLDSWTRFNGTPLARRVPFGKRQALAFAKLISEQSHQLGLAVGQKNTAGLRPGQVGRAGFDFAIAEECGRYRECDAYRRLYGDEVIAIEYRQRDFRRTCETDGEQISVVMRDRLVSTPGKKRYVFASC